MGNRLAGVHTKLSRATRGLGRAHHTRHGLMHEAMAKAMADIADAQAELATIMQADLKAARAELAKHEARERGRTRPELVALPGGGR